MVQWLRNGVPLRWRERAPERSKTENQPQSKEVQSELNKLVRSGAFVEEEASVVAPTFLIPKKDGSMRLIHDLRETNKHIRPPRFTLRGGRDAAQVTRASNWLAVLDLKHGYQQVAMDPAARRYLGARCGDETLVSTVLPFGLNLSPYVFTRITSWLARQIRERFGLEAAVYIDDFLLGAQSREKLEEGINKVKAFFHELGVIISSEKEVRPAGSVEYIGFVWDAQAKTVGVSEARRREYRRAVRNLLRHGQSKATWQRVIGKLGFLREAVGPTMRHIRSLLHTVARRNIGKTLIEAVGEARTDLEWWADKLRHKTELSLVTQPVTASVTTDASDGGLGFVINMDGADDKGKAKQVRFERSLLPSAPEGHINRKEIEAVLRALQTHKEELRGRHVVWYSDSVTALAAIRRQGTQRLSPAAWTAAKEVVDLLEREQVKILPKHVPGRLNCWADALSRPGEERSAWERALGRVTREWGPLQEDPCGATREPSCLLEGLEWSEKRTLLWPRPRDIGKVVEHLALCTASTAPSGHPSLWPRMAVLLTPCWKGASWWPRVKAMRKGFIALGRLSLEDTKGWESRNGHAPVWTASLIPLMTHSGQRRPGPDTRASS